MVVNSIDNAILVVNPFWFGGEKKRECHTIAISVESKITFAIENKMAIRNSMFFFCFQISSKQRDEVMPHKRNNIEGSVAIYV